MLGAAVLILHRVSESAHWGRACARRVPDLGPIRPRLALELEHADHLLLPVQQRLQARRRSLERPVALHNLAQERLLRRREAQLVGAQVRQRRRLTLNRLRRLE